MRSANTNAKISWEKESPRIEKTFKDKTFIRKDFHLREGEHDQGHKDG